MVEDPPLLFVAFDFILLRGAGAGAARRAAVRAFAVAAEETAAIFFFAALAHLDAVVAATTRAVADDVDVVV